MRSHTADYDVVVVGGGLSGVAAAIAAARLDRRVALINNRPVLGGNSSSEVRVWVCGATAHGNQRWARENGIIGELYLENQYRNPDGNPIHWDDVVLDAVRAEPNISLYLNTDVRDVVATGPEGARRIESVTGWTMGAETETRFVAPVFLDCTGDGLVGHLAGARARLGKESRGEFDEDWAPEEAERTFLGSTLLFYTKDVGHPVRFVAPASAKSILETPIPSSRIIRSGDSGAHYWWIEWGGELDIVHDNERIRDELRSVILGIWDHIKNSGEFDAENLDLEWIGNVPGKREYRRLVGDYTLHQRDVIEQTRFDDGVAFGGWSIDLHPKEGMYATGAGAVQRFSNGVFEIPFRSLYSADVENLLMAGRDISATHIAFGAARVMATCAAMGEAAGTAASLGLARRTTPRGLYENHREELRQLLLRQDAPLIGVVDADPANLALSARVSASGVRAGLGPSDIAVARPHPLTEDVGVVVPVHPCLDGFEVRVAAEQDVDLAVEVWSTGLAQNVVPERLEHAVTVAVAAGDARWVHAPVRWEPETPANAVIVVRAQTGVTLFVTDELPPGVLTLVHTSDAEDQNVQVSLDELLVQWPTKPLRGRSVQFRVPTASEALAPERAVGGYQRPFGGPNLWASAPLTEAEAWLRLDWDRPVVAREIVLVFDDDPDIELNTLHHHRDPHLVMPSLVDTYRVEIQVAGSEEWTEVATVADNRSRRRSHPLPPGMGAIDAARVVVTATHGAPEARIVAFRVQE
ncbi:FAD dependent oxidoreductase [Microbacterium testaceum StLB037]|uniref:FAD dependent oxidoreductase n=1 Tax=Microbacterium testaceum (strain StLB037) TaxID=979556 RepID=A0A1H0MUP5_MICTS|nr:FAD-dependent oxidoreductase [Microbacterium testaceum]SDO84092.1 FAD dependent oxidoreductase [Microbacterium testaceum StLB037]